MQSVISEAKKSRFRTISKLTDEGLFLNLFFRLFYQNIILWNVTAFDIPLPAYLYYLVHKLEVCDEIFYYSIIF